MSKFAMACNMKKRMKKECHGGDMADGGEVKSKGRLHDGDHGYGVNPNTKIKGQSNMGMSVREGDYDDAKKEHRTTMKEMSRVHPDIKGLADGGDVDNMHDADMIARIMHKRKMYSKGGEVANGGDDDLDEMADGDPNNFDDLSLRDGLEFSYDGANSGDELGNEQEDEDRHDIISKVMKSRSKKDRNPRPA